MNENVLQFIKDYISLFVSTGFGFGILIGAAASLLGYSIYKVLSFFE